MDFTEAIQHMGLATGSPLLSFL